MHWCWLLCTYWLNAWSLGLDYCASADWSIHVDCCTVHRCDWSTSVDCCVATDLLLEELMWTLVLCLTSWSTGFDCCAPAERRPCVDCYAPADHSTGLYCRAPANWQPEALVLTVAPLLTEVLVLTPVYLLTDCWSTKRGLLCACWLKHWYWLLYTCRLNWLSEAPVWTVCTFFLQCRYVSVNRKSNLIPQRGKVSKFVKKLNFFRQSFHLFYFRRHSVNIEKKKYYLFIHTVFIQYTVSPMPLV